MALFRRLFYRKPPDRLLEIADRVYETMDQYRYKNYLDSIVFQLREQFADSSLMVLNFREEGKSLISGIFSLYSIAVKDYPCQYLGCPVLPLDIIFHFLRLSERWLMLEGQQNILLVHCEKGGWPVLAFMLAGLLLYRKQYKGEQRTLDMVYKQAPKELLQMLTKLNPQPSHLRYLGYICRMDDELGWPTQPIPFTLDCVILRGVPNFDGAGGCRPIVRVYGQDLLKVEKSCNAHSPSSKVKKHVRRYRQADNMPVKLNVGCFVQGDVVLECLHVNDAHEDERLMFRAMFNTFFIQSHILLLKFEDIDVPWNADHRFTKNFKAEVLFSEFDAESDASTEVALDDDEDDEMDAGSADEFFEAEEIFSNADSHEGQKDADMLSLASTDYTPNTEPQKSSPFSNFELDIDIDESQDSQIDSIGLSLETVNDERTYISGESNTMRNNEAAVLKSSLVVAVVGDRDSGISSSSTHRDKKDDCTFQIGGSKQDTRMGSIHNLGQIDNVLVKEVIILETNSPKDIQMIKEVIISEVTTPKQVVEGNTMKNELAEAVDNSEIAFREVENEEQLNIVVKQDDGEGRDVTYDSGKVITQEENRNKEKLSMSDTNVLVHEPSDDNNRMELPSSGEPQLQSSITSLDLSFAEKNMEQLHACNSKDPTDQKEGMDTSLTSSRSQPSNIASVKVLSEQSTFAASLAPTSMNTNANTTNSSRLVLKKKPSGPLSTCSLFAPSSPRRNLLRSASTDSSFLSPLQKESKQNSVASTSGIDALASSSVPPPRQPPISLIPSIKVPSLVHPPLRPIKTVSSLPSSSFEAYIDMSISSWATMHEKHQNHVKPHPPPIPPPRHLHKSMPQEKDLHSSSLTLPASNRYAPHPQRLPPSPPPPPSPRNSLTQSDSKIPTSEHEQKRDDDSCSSGPDCRETVLDLGDSSLTSPSKSSKDTTESPLGSSSFVDEVASRPDILTGMDAPTTSKDTKSLLHTVTCSPPPKTQHGTPKPPTPPPLPLLQPPSTLPQPITCSNSGSIPLVNSNSYSDCPCKEPVMLPEQESPSPLTSLKGHEATVELLQSPVAVESSSLEHSEGEGTVQPMSESTEDAALVLSPSTPAAPAYSPSHDVTNGLLSSTSTEEVPCDLPLDQRDLSIHLEPSEGVSNTEIINGVLLSTGDGKDHGGLSIEPPLPPEVPQPREHIKPPSAPPPPPLLPPPSYHARLVPSPCLSAPSPREYSENPPPTRECLVAPPVPPPPPLIPYRPTRPRKHITPPPPPPIHRENEIICPSPPLSPRHNIPPPPPPPPPLTERGDEGVICLTKGSQSSPVSPTFEGAEQIPTLCAGIVEIPPPPPPSPRGHEGALVSTPKSSQGIPLPPPLLGGLGRIPQSFRFQDRDSSSQKPHGGLGGALPPPPVPPPLPPFSGYREDPPLPSGEALPPPPPPPLPPPTINGGPPPPPPLPGGYIGAPPPPPPPGGFMGAPPPPPPPGVFGGVPPPPPPIGGLGRNPPPTPPAGFRGGAPPPPPPGGHGGTPPPPPPRGHGGVGGPPPPPGAPAPPMPPGAPGGPPPPPGGRGLPNPPGGRGHGLARSLGSNLSTAARRSSLKPLHWVKVTRAMQGSLWAELQKQADANSHAEFDVKELESLFTIAPKTKGGPKAEERGKSLGSKTDKIHLVDLRRANNTEIMLTKIKMPLSDMMSAALALDDSVLDADQVENLIKFCPTKEEMELLKNYSGDKETLGKCEQFFLELMKVPRVESKLRIFAFKIQFQSQIRDVRKNLQTVSSACEELRSSEKLKVIMKNILYMGNTLNQGTPRGTELRVVDIVSIFEITVQHCCIDEMHQGFFMYSVRMKDAPEINLLFSVIYPFITKKISYVGGTRQTKWANYHGQAVGFRLDSLLKLIETRATNSRMTLMHFLCKSLAEKSPEVLDFHEDLVSLEVASKLQLKALAEEQQAVVKGLEKVEQELTASENDGPVSELFCKTLKEFIDASGADVRSLSALYSEVGRNADSLVIYFGEDPAKFPFEQVASTLLTFVGLFRKAHDENLKQIEAEKKKAQKEAEKEANQDRTPVKSKNGFVDRSPRSPSPFK
ncbi:hypothetical protein EJB05_00849 [Eragrostis curvula]|uniref:Formin-like protein n=1 Tax=Eragrostis curvula TaxID=38414 RepID=A0A5J9WNI5_9POAL|nr:hypothetical protein EJB05_00849 [Eragrostis curvula]